MKIQRLSFIIHLTSDAEPGCGIGSELVNNFVPRTVDGFPCLPASHIRGLVRQNLLDLENRHSWSELSTVVLGAPGIDGDDGHPGAVRFGDAISEKKRTLVLSRTAIDDWGKAKETSLRTVELIPAGTDTGTGTGTDTYTLLRGVWSIDAAPGTVIDLAARLGLLMIMTVGAGRTRGAGACWVEIEGETRTPGQLLQELEKAIARDGIPEPPRLEVGTQRKALSGKNRWVRLVFHAQSPLCCPETPVIGINVMRSGFSIPASAVIGALLTRVDRMDSPLASSCFDALREHKARVFPLLPVASQGSDNVPDAVRVSMTHRLSKLPNAQGCHDFRDEAIEPYDWREVPAGSPLKSVDGVMLLPQDGVSPKLWMSKDMPRVIQTHGVHRDPKGNRNLFTVEAMAPLVFTGWASLPEEMVDVLQKSLKENPYLSMGRSRGAMGDGKLSIEEVSPSRILKNASKEARVWVVQSPIAIPNDIQEDSAETMLQIIAQKAGWPVEETWAKAGVRFGWNRHGLGAPAREGHKRTQARRCILPGSVIVLAKSFDDPENILLRGLGDGAEDGFGALLPHPGIAKTLFRPHPALVKIQSKSKASRDAFFLWKKAGTSGPTPSQIAHLAGQLAAQKASQWLQKQKERPARIWNRWSEIYVDVQKIVQSDPQDAREVLRIWQDLAIANRKGDR